MAKIIVLLLLLSPQLAAGESITVAVASNFHTTAKQIAKRFTDETGIGVRISAGSTGKLYAQIVNAAPYDVFLSADVARPQKLIEQQHADAGSLFVYAVGQLVIWSSSQRFNDEDCTASLAAGNFSHLAIANPKTAPYGLAAKNYLIESGVWQKSMGKIVYGENVSQAFSFVATGNADLGLVAASQLMSYSGDAVTCSELIALPKAGAIEQAAVLLSRARDNASAIAFLDYLRSPDVKTMLISEGYAPAPNAVSGRN